MKKLLLQFLLFVIVSYTDSSVLNYYNSKTCLANKDNPKPFRSVIALVLPEFYQKLDGYTCSRPCRILDKRFVSEYITLIDRYFDDSARADIVIFHQGYPARKAIEDIRSSTSRSVDFVNIDDVFTRPPEQVDPYSAVPTERALGDRKWVRQQLIRFQAIDMFQFPVMDNVRYIFHVHYDGCFENSFSNLFNRLWKNKIIYAHAGIVNQSPTASEFVKIDGLLTVTTNETDRLLAMNGVEYHTDIEILSIDYFRSPSVQSYLEQIRDSGGIFTAGWSLGQIRYAVLSTADRVDNVSSAIAPLEDFGIRFKQPCQRV